jgi:outer membrane protein W
MTRRIVLGALALAVVIVVQANPASAQQSLTVQVGAFMPRGEAARVENDVLVTNRQYLLFDVDDFNAMTVGGEWSVGLGEYFEAGVGFGFYQRTVPTVYADWVNADGREIEQDLTLRIMPLTAIVKILPLGSKRAFQPYVGGGLGVYFWHYSEAGEFVDFVDDSIFRDAFVTSGTSVGPVAVFGIRGRVSSQALIGVEGRLQWGEGDLSQDFLSDKIDLGGFSVLATFGYRF